MRKLAGFLLTLFLFGLAIMAEVPNDQLGPIIAGYLDKDGFGSAADWVKGHQFTWAVSHLFQIVLGMAILSLALFVTDLVVTVSRGRSRASAKISFQKMAVFWVIANAHAFRIAVVAKLFNAGTDAVLVDGLVFDGRRWSFFPRGSYHLRRLFQSEPKAQVIEDSYIKPHSEAYMKLSLPIVFDMTIKGGSTPDFVLRGTWHLSVLEHQRQLEAPKLYSVFSDPISEFEWQQLGKSGSAIRFEDLNYVEMPPEPLKEAPVESYLIYNKNRSATFRNPYYAQTPVKHGARGAMLFVRGKGKPPLDEGWTVLGRTYFEVWSNPQTLELYNSIFPPDNDGSPQPFGFFLGAEQEMSGPVGRQLLAPTTRAADILDFSWP